MSLDAAQRQLLRMVLKKRARAELKALFAAIRTHDDRTLLEALRTPKKKAKRRGDPLVAMLEATLKPVLAPAAEKAQMLVEHLAKKHRRKFAFEPKGLADAVRRLRLAKFSDAQIRAGGESLVAQLIRLHGRESVV